MAKIRTGGELGGIGMARRDGYLLVGLPDNSEESCVATNGFTGDIVVSARAYGGNRPPSIVESVKLVLTRKQAAQLALDLLGQLPALDVIRDKETFKRLQNYVDLAKHSRDEEDE